MERQLTATLVVILFCLLYTVAIAAQAKGAGEKKRSISEVVLASAEPETRDLVQRLGFGKRVDVQLKNGTKAGGRITGLALEQFVVTDTKGAPTPVAYSDVARITKQKEKLGLFHKPWVGIMFTAAGVGTLIVLALALFD